MSLDEDDLTRMLQESVDELEAPVPAMLSEAARAGRRRIRVRRTLQAAGAAGTAAALVAVGALVAQGHGSGTRDVQAATRTGAHASVGAVSSPTAASTTAAPTTAPVPASAAPSGGTSATTDLTWQATLKILADLLPQGAHLGNLDPVMTRSGDHYSSLQVEYDDGAGAVTISVNIARTATSGMIGAVTDCTNWSGKDEGSRRPGYLKPACALTQLPDGGKLLSITSGTDAAGLYTSDVRLTRPNGDYVQIQVPNGTLDQPKPHQQGSNITITRDRPPVDTAALAAIAENPAWQFKIPQSLADGGAAFAKTVSQFPCPAGAQAHCVTA